MLKTLNLVFDWSEVWAVLIPLFVLASHRRQPRFMQPVIFYLWIALFLNLTGDFIADFRKYLPAWLHGNDPIYNVHSIIRFACFGIFFYRLGNFFRGRIDKITVAVALMLIFINFGYYENFFDEQHLSGNLLALEAFVLLVYCMRYYLIRLRMETVRFSGRKDFWVVTGLSIYVVINFFVFLFYVPLLTENPDLADRMWSIHNLAYITMCIFIAKAFYEPA